MNHYTNQILTSFCVSVTVQCLWQPYVYLPENMWFWFLPNISLLTWTIETITTETILTGTIVRSYCVGTICVGITIVSTLLTLVDIWEYKNSKKYHKCKQRKKAGVIHTSNFDTHYLFYNFRQVFICYTVNTLELGVCGWIIIQIKFLRLFAFR